MVALHINHKKHNPNAAIDENRVAIWYNLYNLPDVDAGEQSLQKSVYLKTCTYMSISILTDEGSTVRHGFRFTTHSPTHRDNHTVASICGNFA